MEHVEGNGSEFSLLGTVKDRNYYVANLHIDVKDIKGEDHTIEKKLVLVVDFDYPIHIKVSDIRSSVGILRRSRSRLEER